LLFKILFIITIFFSAACSSKKQPLLSACLTAEEKADLEYFFRFLMFENYGAFVLFGSKSLCQTHLDDEESTDIEPAFQKWVSSLPDDRRAKIEAAINKAHVAPEPERNPYRGWLALEKVRRNFKIKNFIFRLIPVYFLDSDALIPDSYDLVLINVQQTALVLAENYEVFKTASVMDFDPLQVVFEAQNADSIFWKNVFSMKNHLAKGLLFGFGLKNSIFFNWRELYSNAQQDLASDSYTEDVLKYLQNHRFEFSTAPVGLGKGSPSNFTITMFRAIVEDDTVEKYTKEKAAIEKIYRGHDMVEVTLRRLVGLY
jgi:hypothetical protein